MGAPLPRVHFDRQKTLVGSPKIGQNPIWAWEYAGLFMSEPHFRRKTHKGRVWSGGGPFYVYREKVSHNGRADVPIKRSGIDQGVYTAYGVSPIGSSLTPAPPTSIPTWASKRADASASYATGYKKARPGNPVASLGQFLIELRDLPRIPLGLGKIPISRIPRTLRDKHDWFRSLGSEYLNVQFGWMPFVNDLRKMYYLWQDIDKRLAQLVRENGKYIRRRATVQDDQVDVDTEQVYTFPWANVFGSPPNYMAGRTLYTTKTRTKTKIWFSGSFRYYVPDIGSSQWTTRAKLALFGALPTPELLWEVLPWSWLVDWFSNVGDVASNASMNAVDNLTLRYSFIMKHVSTETSATAVIWSEGRSDSSNYWPAVAQTFTSTKLVESKVRVGGGNPFGLDVSLGSLSGHQLGILAALGLSRQKLL